MKSKCRWFHFTSATWAGRALKFGFSTVHIVSSQTLFFLQFTFLKSLSCSMHWEINSRVSSVSSLLHHKPFLLSAASSLTLNTTPSLLAARQWRHYSSSSGYSPPGNRIAGMGIQVFRNDNSSQTNVYSHFSNYSYSGLIPNERTLSCGTTTREVNFGRSWGSKFKVPISADHLRPFLYHTRCQPCFFSAMTERQFKFPFAPEELQCTVSHLSCSMCLEASKL